MEREIKPEEVRVGDTIRLCYAITVSKLVNNGITLRAYGDGLEQFCLEDFNILLLSRPLPEYKYQVGQKVKIPIGETATIRNLKGHNENGEPLYRAIIQMICSSWENVYRESELTPIEEEAWEPKFGDLAKLKTGYCGLTKKVSVLRFSHSCISAKRVFVSDGEGEWWVDMVQLSKWEGE